MFKKARTWSHELRASNTIIDVQEDSGHVEEATLEEALEELEENVFDHESPLG